MATTKTQLKAAILNAMDLNSDKELDPAEARDAFAQRLADAIEAYVVTRTTTVTGTSATGGAVTGTGIIQ